MLLEVLISCKSNTIHSYLSSKTIFEVFWSFFTGIFKLKFHLSSQGLTSSCELVSTLKYKTYNHYSHQPLEHYSSRGLPEFGCVWQLMKSSPMPENLHTQKTHQVPTNLECFRGKYKGGEEFATSTFTRKTEEQQQPLTVESCRSATSSLNEE